MDNAIMLIVLIVLIMALIAVLTGAKQQEAVEEGFLGWKEKDSRVKKILGDYKYNDKVAYPGLTGNYANYCRMYANLDACRWSPKFRNGYCKDECKEGKSMNCYYGRNRYHEGGARRRCSHKWMDNRGRIDTCKSVLSEYIYPRLDSGKLPKDHPYRESALNPAFYKLKAEKPMCTDAI